MHGPKSVLFCAAILLASVSAVANNQIVNIQASFTNVAYLPASTDVGSIRFEQLRMVKIPADLNYGIDATQCQELVTGQLWQSSSCSYSTIHTTVPAVEVIYSFTAAPLASDEYANRTFEFSVYLRPEDLPEALQKVHSGRKLTRSEEARYFAVNIRRDAVPETATNPGSEAGDALDPAEIAVVIKPGNWASYSKKRLP